MGFGYTCIRFFFHSLFCLKLCDRLSQANDRKCMMHVFLLYAVGKPQIRNTQRRNGSLGTSYSSVCSLTLQKIRKNGFEYSTSFNLRSIFVSVHHCGRVNAYHIQDIIDVSTEHLSLYSMLL